MIYAIGDLHFDYSKEKPMDIFGDKWINHEKQVIDNWRDLVEVDDLVLMPGDISWALKLEEAYFDLKKIDDLPGIKIISKGNHDYWWESLRKMKALDFQSISFLHNNFFQYKNTSIHGTRGWISRDSMDFKEEDEKIFSRELLRLGMSLDLAKDKMVEKKIVMIHYPPFNNDLSPNEFVEVMKGYDVDICIYGHLHAEGHKLAVEGSLDGIEFYCVSSDYIGFEPRLILNI